MALPRVCQCTCKTFTGLNVPYLWYYTIQVTNCFVILIWKYCLINNIPFASLVGNMLYVNKGLQSTVTWQCRKAMNERFMLEHNNDSITVAFGNCLPGTELLLSPFRMEFSMGSRLRRHCWSLLRHRRFLRSYRQSLQRCRDPWGDWRPCSRRSLRDSLNIIKHC